MPLARPRSETAVAPVKFAHVVFRTRQKDAMVAWWTTVLQAKVQHENALLAFLTYQGIKPYWTTINHGPTTSCYYPDPDGNQPVEELVQQGAA
jgi:hypothetical protein